MKRSEQAERIRHTEWLKRWADAVSADEESRFTRRLMLAIFLTFSLAVTFWLAAWLMR